MKQNVPDMKIGMREGKEEKFNRIKNKISIVQ